MVHGRAIHKIFAGEFERVTSYFSGTPLAAEGLPAPAELELLEPFRAELPPAVFGPMYEQPSTRPPGSLRKSLTRALELLAEAGWHNIDGVLKNARGESFVIEVAGSRGQSPYLDAYYLNLTKLGVVLRRRLTDATASRQRMNQFDFDFTSVALREARMPGAELWRTFNGRDADSPGSENLVGVKSRAVDALLQKLLDAESEGEQQVAARALDRVLTHNHYLVPWRYLTHHYLVYNRRLARPSARPRIYGPYEWAIQTWWDAEPAASAGGVARAAPARGAGGSWFGYSALASVLVVGFAATAFLHRSRRDKSARGGPAA